jgi:endonuclease I
MKYKALILALLALLGCIQNEVVSKETSVKETIMSEKYKKAYAEMAELEGEELKAKLHNLIIHHKTYVYYTDDADTTVGSMMEVLDADPDKEGNIILFYTGRSQGWKWRDQGWDVDYKDYPILYDNTWNREHIWVKSHGFPNLADTAFTDVHHIRPADRTVNSDRGTRDYDWGGWPHPEAEGAYSDYDSFEPADDIKGDVARMILYMAVRYEGDNGTYDLEILDKTGTYGPRLGKLSTLLEWHKLDPVSDRERIRNDKIDKYYQHNRNPFIDHPEFAEKIWGEVKSQPILRVSEKKLKFYESEVNSGNVIKQLLITSINAKNEKVTITCPASFKVRKSGTDEFGSELVLTDLSERNQILDVKFTPTQEGLINQTMKITDGKDFNFNVKMFGIGVPEGSNVIYSEDFDNEPTDWEKVSFASNLDWVYGSYGNNYFMKAKGFGGNEPAEDWLITPKLDLSSVNNPLFSFENAKNHKDIKPGLEVFISTNYDGKDLKKATWEKLDVNLSNGKWNWVFSGLIDLSKYKTDNVHIAFKYTCSSTKKAESWEIDRFRILGQ